METKLAFDGPLTDRDLDAGVKLLRTSDVLVFEEDERHGAPQDELRALVRAICEAVAENVKNPPVVISGEALAPLFSAQNGEVRSNY